MQPLYSWLHVQLKSLAYISLDLGFILSDIIVSQNNKKYFKSLIFPLLKDKKLHPFTFLLTDSKPLSD